MRNEKAKKELENFRFKPKISENSQRIVKNSKRAKETAEILEKLAGTEAKKVILIKRII